MLDGEINGKPAILSTEIANRFNKKHCHVLRDIDTLRSILPCDFVEANFLKIHYDAKIGNGAIRKEIAWLLTRDAFSLLAMGLTGKAAVIWKLRYIEAFNALEKMALDENLAFEREQAYLKGRMETLSLANMQAERKKGYLEGLNEGKKLALKNDRLAALQKIASYVAKGLSYAEIGKIIGISKSGVYKRVARAKKLGFWPSARQAQGCLMEVM